MQDVASVTMVARLGRDPELRTLPNGNAVCSLRVAWNQSRKDGDGWKDEPGWIDVTVFGKQGERCSQYLSKGRQIIVDGRLDYREWKSEDGKTQARHQIVANQVQFIGSNDEAPTNNRREPARTTDAEPPPF